MSRIAFPPIPEPHPDLRFGILRDVAEWLPQLIGRWNQTQMAIFASTTDPLLDHGLRAERLRAAHDAQYALVMDLRFRVAGLDDPEMLGSLTPIIENYQERLALTERFISAILRFDDGEVDRVAVAYGAFSSQETMRPLLERVYRHPDLVRIFDALGLNAEKLLDALFG